jgi:hypothetical protein
VNGTGTVNRTGSYPVCSFIVSAKLDNNKSHRSIHFKLKNGEFSDISSYIIEESLATGYYWSESTTSDGNPYSPTYIGTSSDGFTLNETQHFLWYTSDGGKSW